MEEWLRSPVILHDIWNIDITVKANGNFSHIDSRTRKKVPLLDSRKSEELKVLRKKINNYFRYRDSILS